MHLKFKNMTDEQVRKIIATARLQFHFVLKIYEMQLAAGRRFLHEHPQSASSWKDPRW